MSFRTHPAYQRLIEKARSSHANNRSVGGVESDDITLARLYSHAYRGHVIGAFYATQVALNEAWQGKSAAPLEIENRRLAIEYLTDLSAQALDPISADYAALLSSLYRYDTNIRRALQAIDRSGGDAATALIRAKFVTAIERISNSGGIVCTRDDEVPDQASFIVPNLGITIVPLVYGDHHSWNLAYLSSDAPDVPRHLHQQGVEIHLGTEHVQGFTLLGSQRVEVHEGYAMSIPPKTAHGFKNTSGKPHYLPFVFGSIRMAGWGVFLDVEAQPIELEELTLVERSGRCLNGLVYLDREIERAARLPGNARWPLVKPEATFQAESGALVLSISRVGSGGMTLPGESFRIVSVVRGQGAVTIGPAEQQINRHDHFGIPSGVSAKIKPVGDAPLVILDAVLVKKLGRTF